MAPDGRKDGRMEEWMDGHGQTYIPPPSVGQGIIRLDVSSESSARQRILLGRGFT